MRRVHLAALAVSLVFLLLAGTASAAATWLSPVDLSVQGRDAWNPQVALGPAGDATVIWYSAVDSPNPVIQEASHTAGGSWTWTAAETLSGDTAYGAQVALDPAGNALAVWERFDNSSTSFLVQASARPAGGAWEAPQNLSAPGHDANNPQVALDAAGNAIVVWQRWNGATMVVQGAVRPFGGAWQAAQDLSSGYATDPQVALDPAGDAVAVWQYFNGSNTIVQAVTRPAGGAWSTPQDISAAGQSVSFPQVAVDAAGNAIAVWARSNGSNTIVQAAARPVEGAWGSPQDLSAPGQNADLPEVAVSPAGDAVAVWQRSDGANTIVQAAVRAADGGWGTAQDLSAAGQNSDFPQVAVDPAGNSVAVWTSYENGTEVVQAATRPAGSAWGAPQTLSAFGWPAFHAQVAVDPAGNALAVWYRYNGLNMIIQAAALDAVGPIFDDLTIPATGTAGKPLAFSVSPFDAWSQLFGSPHWDFGDGTTSEASTLTYAYHAQGSYTVTLSQSDAVGNQSSVSRTVTIAPAPIQCVVPKVVGKTLAKAKAAIKRRHCRTGRVARAFSKKVRSGRVLAQRPKAGKHLPKGARVNLVISRGKRR
jgi:hypothetical protein